MKSMIFGVAICISSAALAQPTATPRPTPAAAPEVSDKEARLALEEKMGQMQLDLLIAQFVEADRPSTQTPSRSADASAPR